MKSLSENKPKPVGLNKIAVLFAVMLVAACSPGGNQMPSHLPDGRSMPSAVDIEQRYQAINSCIADLQSRADAAALTGDPRRALYLDRINWLLGLQGRLRGAVALYHGTSVTTESSDNSFRFHLNSRTKGNVSIRGRVRAAAQILDFRLPDYCV